MTAGWRVLVLGGARSGKSAHAEAVLLAEPSVDYLATSSNHGVDEEWAERIARHRERRPAHWRTIETADLASVLVGEGPAALIDSVTGWLAGVLETSGTWRDEPGARDRVTAAVDAAVGAWASTPRRVVAVSDEVGSGVVPEFAAGRLFRDALGLLNQRLASSADEVWLVTAGIPLRLR